MPFVMCFSLEDREAAYLQSETFHDGIRKDISSLMMIVADQGPGMHVLFTILDEGSEMQTKVETRAESWTLQDVLCTLGSGLSTRTQELRSRENAFGCLVADAMLQACRLHGCDGAVINGGFIRQDCCLCDAWHHPRVFDDLTGQIVSCQFWPDSPAGTPVPASALCGSCFCSRFRTSKTN